MLLQRNHEITRGSKEGRGKGVRKGNIKRRVFNIISTFLLMVLS